MKKYFVYFDVILINKHNAKLVNIIIIKNIILVYFII